MKYYYNPFRYGKPVPPNCFVGRTDALRLIFSRLRNSESTAIIGTPHIGKSSFLRYIHDDRVRTKWLDKEAPRYAFINIDCHLLSNTYRPADFWKEVLVCIGENFSAGTIQRQIEVVQQSGYGSFSLKRLFDLLGRSEMRAIVLVDEFDVLLHHGNFNTAEFFGALRAFAIQTDGLAVLLASRMRVAEMNRRSQEINPLGSPFFNNLIEVCLLPLHSDEVDQLIDRALDGTGIIFSQEDRAYIKRATGRHPFLVQIAAAALYEAYTQSKVGLTQYIEMDKMVQRWAAAHFEDTWRLLNADVQDVLLALAQSELREESDRNRAGLEQHSPELRWLTDSELIERTNQAHCATWRGDHWRISARSFAEWIVNNARATSQDVRDARQPIDRTKLRQILSVHFDEDELRILCFDLRVDYQNLPGEGKANKAMELIAYCERSSRLPELIATARQHRPNAPW